MEKGLLEKTGKPLDHWVKIVKASKIEKHKEIINFLKSEHDFTYGFANFVAHKSKQSDAESIDDGNLIEGQFKGKESLKPIHDTIVAFVNSFGSELEIAPKKTSGMPPSWIGIHPLIQVIRSSPRRIPTMRACRFFSGCRISSARPLPHTPPPRSCLSFCMASRALC